jgi:serine/threonine protein kinase
MNGPLRPCDEQRLQTLLTAEEDTAEYRAAAEHLESCAVCRERLSDLAGEPCAWDEARGMLAGDETDAQIQQEETARPWQRFLSSSDTNAWTESMVRQLLSPPSHPEMLGRLGRYEIERWLGAGGMGVVFKGFDTELNRPVAIKVLAPHLAGNGAARQRFAREARAAAAVVHEHVVAIHDVESDSATPYLVMHYVAGESLQTRLDRQGPLELCEILRIAHQTASGLAAAHAQGLVHRDVKPSNILLEQGVDRALLTDFGLARAADDASLTHTGYLPGTPHYMSPEQARGEPVDARGDLFSLGSVIYAMCTGRPPFRADTGFGILRRITDTEPRALREVNPAIPAWLETLVARLHAKRPADRLSSADDAAGLLEKCLAHVQQPNVVPLPDACRPRPLRRWATRRRALTIGTPLVGLTLVVLAVLYPWMDRTPTDFGTRDKAHSQTDLPGAVPSEVVSRQGLSQLRPAHPVSSMDKGTHAEEVKDSLNGQNTTLPSADRDKPNEALGPAISPSDLDWDSAAREVESLIRDSESLRAAVERLWQQQPAPQTSAGDDTPADIEDQELSP